jgi:hypothetical protein
MLHVFLKSSDYLPRLRTLKKPANKANKASKQLDLLINFGPSEEEFSGYGISAINSCPMHHYLSNQECHPKLESQGMSPGE